ncbi:MAG: hypothetical protein VX899_14600 [Myxococcota bacterium]|nr:hypothetical protein [Myxococcota bacterium]
MFVWFVAAVGCANNGMCDWERVPLEDAEWAGQEADQWAAPYLGSWTVEPIWTSEDRRPPVGVGELFQLDLFLSDAVAEVERIVEAGNCDPSPKLMVPLLGSVQSLDGGIQAVSAGSESDWSVVVEEDGLTELRLQSNTDSGSLYWHPELFGGSPEEGYNYRFWVTADEDAGLVDLDVTVRTKDVNKGGAVWVAGTWSW